MLASPLYRRLWLSGIIYYGAYWVEIITTGWVVFELTDSPFLVGLSGFCRMVPMLLFGLFLGAVADRVRRSRILIGVQLTGLLATLTLAAAFSAGLETLWIIYPMVALIGCGWAADFSARRALIDDIQHRSLLANSMSLEAMSLFGGKIIATITAGFLLQVGGAALGYWCAAGLYAFGLLWMLALNRRLPVVLSSKQPAVRLVSTLRTGWSVAMSIPVMRGVLAVTVIVNVLIFPYQQLIAIVAGDILEVGPFWMGLLASADGAGAVMAAAWLAFSAGPARQGLVFLGGATGAAALLLGLGLSEIYVLSLLIQFAIGCCVGFFSAYQPTLVLNAVPPETRSRAMGLIATAIGMTPVGMLLIGGLGSTTGAQLAIVAMSLTGLTGLLIISATNRPLREARAGRS